MEVVPLDRPAPIPDGVMPERSAHVFVLGLDEFNRKKLEALPPERGYVFHPLLSLEEVTSWREFPLAERLDAAVQVVEAWPGGADAVVGYWDFPVSLMVPILCCRLGLVSPSLESVLRCEHKYWSRLVQREVAPEHVPPFTAVDPFDDASLNGIGLAYPFWLKPVKSFSSHLGFRVRHREELQRAVRKLREGVGDVGEPFNQFLAQANLPEEVTPVTGLHCIAERIVSGSQCTLEGFVHGDEVEIYGVVDSVRHGNRSTFSRYEYPSRLPRTVRERMRAVARRVIEGVGLSDAPFNMEFFWDEAKDRIWLLEVNPRISQSHGDLFEKVDGVPNHEVAVELALGRRPEWRKGAGPFRRAGKFFARRFEDATVIRTPSEEEVEQVERKFPGAIVEVLAEPGTRLSELDPQEQDSYSFVYARVFLGASNQRELLERHRWVMDALPFEFAPVEGVAAAEGK